MQMRLTQILESAARLHGDSIAVIDADRTLTYGELHTRAGRCAALLRGLGVGAEDRVCILALNSHQNLEMLFGTVRAGGILAPLNYRLAPAELAEIVNMVEARVLAVDSTFAELGRMLAARCACIEHVILLDARGGADGTIDYEQALPGHAPISDAMRADEDVATIFFTGGTTGSPKGVMQTHANLVASALMYVARWGWTRDVRLLGSAPMFHVAAAAVIPPVLLAGGSIVMMPRFDPIGYAELIERHRITFANGVPTMLAMVVDAPGFRNRDLSSLTGMNMGGSTVPPALVRRLADGFPNAAFYNTYGMTEATSAVTVSQGIRRDAMPDAEWQWTTVGRATPLTDVRVFDRQDRECPPETVGEIRVRGPLVMKGYWRHPEATAATIVDGWLRTGDLGYADAQGNLFLIDRLKDMIISGGENVYSAEVEAAIRDLDGVAEVAVFGVADERWGERVHAVVVPDVGAALTADQIIAHCREQIAGFKVPRSVDLRDTPLPLSGAGKISKPALRAEYASPQRG